MEKLTAENAREITNAHPDDIGEISRKIKERAELGFSYYWTDKKLTPDGIAEIKFLNYKIEFGNDFDKIKW